MSSHPYASAPNSKKPYIGISYYAYQTWFDLIDQDKLTKWEKLRFKLMEERYSVGRAFLQIPVIAFSYFCGHIIMGPPLRRRDGGFRETFVFSTFFYVIFHDYIDRIRAPDRFLDELFTQSDPDGQYLRTLTKRYYPGLWEDIRQQMLDKGVQFQEPEDWLENYPKNDAPDQNEVNKVIDTIKGNKKLHFLLDLLPK